MMITLWCGMRRHAPRTWFPYTQPARWCGVIAVRYLTQTYVDVYYVLEYYPLVSTEWIEFACNTCQWIGSPLRGNRDPGWSFKCGIVVICDAWCTDACMMHEPRPPFHIPPKVHTCKRGYFFSYTTFVLDSIRAFVGLMDTLYSQKPCRDFSLGYYLNKGDSMIG